MKHLVVVVMAGLLMSAATQAQTPAACPTGVNPLQVLVGTWTFTSNGFTQSAPGSSSTPFASIGRFSAMVVTRSGQQVGVLTVLRTANNNGQVSRLESDAGSYQVYPDCSGGTLNFNLSTGPVQYEFLFNGMSALNLVSTSGSQLTPLIALGSSARVAGLFDDVLAPSGTCIAACLVKNCPTTWTQQCQANCEFQCIL